MSNNRSSHIEEDAHSASDNDSQAWSSESEFSYDDDDENEDDDQSEERTIESQRLIAIGVLQDEDGEKKPPAISRLQQQQQQQQQIQHVADETVANRIAREEHETKMRIKQERMGRAKRVSRSQEEREAKMRTVQARKGVPRSRPQRGTSKPKAQQETTSEAEEESSLASSMNQETVASSASRSVSSGIDLDEKTRQRIISRSTLRYARQRAATTTRTATNTNSARPSDDKRNLRISPKKIGRTNPNNNNNNNEQQQARLSDEKAAFRRHRPRRARAISSQNVAPNGLEDGEIDNDNVDIPTAETNNEETFVEDVEAQQQQDFEEEEEEPQVLPGAFAVSGIGDDDDDGQGVSGYDSGFENDSLLGTQDLTDDLEQDLSSPQADLETAGSTIVDASTAVPLTAELYEENQGVTAVSAQVVLPEEEEGKVKIRKLWRQIAVAFLIIVAIVGTITGVLLRRGVGGNDEEVEEDIITTVSGWTQVGDILTVQDPYKDNIRFGNAVAISGDGNRVAVGLPGLDDSEDGIFRSVGSVQIFDLINGTFVSSTEIFGVHSIAELGTNVALSDDGKRLAIGAPSYNSDETGYVEIYQESNITGQWTLAANFSGDTEDGVFGDAVGFSGDGRVVAIGDKYSDDRGVNDVGAVTVYQEIDGTWSQMGTTLLGSKNQERFGWSVSLSRDGNRVAASSLSGSEPGSVQVFDFDGTAWELAGSSLVGESTRESFGVSVELSRDGSVVAVSATDYSREGQEDGVGVVRSYKYNEDNWEPYGQPLEGEKKLDAFGSSISLSQDGNRIAIGGPENGNFCNNCGQVKVFENSGGNLWKPIGSALGKTDLDNGQFGYAVALSATGDRVVGAAPFTKFDGFFSKVGQVLVFDTIEDDIETD
eukprot:CAMPEP_0116143768 /NCGR_PEP_ID=MMETSP0329-20121206/15628_1 /TAXON_ID=697910 /ORGANISM="Pseudo-nitzschia arenysensis, Strain B593" /LENGTH=881 /DNA_ID=CAMNT_0003639113 /DNA_START=187 /DNA_END=2832 /DNA_ORIENTATION=+